MIAMPAIRPVFRRSTGRLAGLGTAALLGVAIGVAPGTTALAGLVLAFGFAIAAHPPFGIYALLVSTLLLAGIDRGVLIPLLRPHEAVAAVVGTALIASALLPAWRLRAGAAALRLQRVDMAVLALAVCGSVIPLMWMGLREREVTTGDLVQAAQLWKYAAGYAMVRFAIRTPRQVAVCLCVVLGTAAIVAVVGILQSLDLFGARGLLATTYATLGDPRDFGANRATSTLGFSFAVADLMVFALALSIAWMARGGANRPLLAALAALFALGTVAAGQFSGVIGLIVAVFVVGKVTRSLGRSLLAVTGIVLAAAVVLRPVVESRLSSFKTPSGVPQGWQLRVDNLREYFWPELFSDWNWLTGVAPVGRLPATETWRDFVYIENGHTWLLWTGGLAFLLAFGAFLVLGLKATRRVALARADPVGVAAIASFAVLTVTGVLMVLDDHLSLRGSADVSFTLLALALVGIGQRAATPLSHRETPASQVPAAAAGRRPGT